VEYNITTLIDNTTPVEYNITTLIDKTTPVEYHMLFSYQSQRYGNGHLEIRKMKIKEANLFNTVGSCINKKES
jgi:hypothetical protein